MHDSLPAQDDSSSLNLLGLDPAHPFYDLNLAGAQGIPSPQQLATPLQQSSAILLADFSTPDDNVPGIKPYNLSGAGVTLIPELSADPALPTLSQYSHPHALDIVPFGMEPDSSLAHDIPTEDEVAASLYPGLGFEELRVQTAGDALDPSVPDLQRPSLTPQVQMPADERPAELAPTALDVLHGTPGYQQVSDKHYPSSWMDARGMNTTRARHLSLLDDGLES